MVSQYLAGRSFRELEDMVGTCYMTIQKCLKRNGVWVRRNVKYINLPEYTGLSSKAIYRKRVSEDPDLREKRWQTEYTRRLRVEYGLSRAEYEELLASQDGACLICRRPPTQGNPLCVDHCHNTGDVRGVLCDDCNVMIARAHDDPEVLRRAVDYLHLPPYKRGSAKKKSKDV